MSQGISLTSGPIHDDCHDNPVKDCGEKHKLRVANATLEIAIDLNTDFKCDTV